MTELAQPSKMIARIRRDIVQGNVDIYVRPMRHKDFGAANVETVQDIHINNKQSDAEKIITLFHEYMHIRYPDLVEDRVEKCAQEMYRLLTDEK